MSISEKIEKIYKNRIKSIKKMKNGLDRDYAIGSLIADLGTRSIKSVCKFLKICYRKAKKCYNFFINGGIQMSFEFRGRKKIEEKNPKLKQDILEIMKKYEITDSHFKTEKLYADISLNNLRLELINNYGYTENDCPSKPTLSRILKELGYRITKVKKIKVQSKIKETDEIFNNVHETMNFALKSGDEVAVISMDDKARKLIGDLSSNGYSWFEKKTLDHDTLYDCSINPFGILDLKTNEPFVYCTKGCSTADFKVDCISSYIESKMKTCNLKRLIIFLDNGPENSSKRKLWRKRIIELAIKYKITIELAYYPPYHSKYNKIERYWARVQLSWMGVIINTVDKLIEVLNKITWKGIKTSATFIDKEYVKGKIVDEYELYELDKKHVERTEGIEKWSLIITP